MTWFKTRAPVLRALEPEDAEDCAKLHATSFAHPWSAAEFETLLTSPSVLGETASLREQASAGFVLSRSAADEAEILTVAVDPRHRRRGLGRLLMDQHLDRLVRFGVRTLFLEVDERNAAARALYARLGFAQVGARAAYYRQGAGDAPHSALVLRRAL